MRPHRREARPAIGVYRATDVFLPQLAGGFGSRPIFLGIAMPHCIMIMRDAKYCIVGPFESKNALHSWTEKHWHELDRKPGSCLDPSDPAAVAAIQE